MELLLASAGFGLAVAALVYIIGATIIVLFARYNAPDASAGTLPVTVFKPLCGAEPGLYESLRGFFQLDYPSYQLIFGVRHAGDPALDVVTRLQAEFPAVDVCVVDDPRVHGRNLKVSNLLNMAAKARHDTWVISDSDIRVAPDYVQRMTAALADPNVGAVTALYASSPLSDTIAGALAALHVDDWFLPSVLVARALGKTDFCLGSTMAVRRDTLRAIGGFEALKDYLADDYMLGLLLGRAGYRVALAPDIVRTTVTETTFAELFAHELRWARTIKSVEPLSFVFSCLMNTISVAFIAAVLLVAAGQGWSVALLTVTLAVMFRLGLHAAVGGRLERTDRKMWLVPLRDLISFAIWARSFIGRSVAWRGQKLTVDGRGVLADVVGEGTS